MRPLPNKDIFLSNSYFQICVLLFFVTIPYLNCLTNGFVWVDTSEILEGRLIINSWGEFIRTIFHDAHNYSNYHRPVYNIIHSIDYYLWERNPLGYHISSIILHLSNVVLVYLIACRFFLINIYAFTVALIWGLLPANVSVVSLIHSKADLLVGFFMLLSMIIGIHVIENFNRFSFKLIIKIFLAGSSLALALLSKETAFVFPLMFSILVYYKYWAARKKISLTISFFFWGIALSFFLFRISLDSLTYSSHNFLRLDDRILSFIPVYIDYIIKTFSTYELTESDSIMFWRYYPVPIFVIYTLAFFLFIYLQFESEKISLVTYLGFFWYNIFLFPVCQVFPILHFRADRFLYMPSIGLILALVPLVDFLLNSSKKYPISEDLKKKIKLSLCACVILYFSLRIWNRNAIFLDDTTLFENVISQHPECREAHSFLARIYSLKGDMKQAGHSFESSLMVDPRFYSYVDTYSNLTNYGLYLMGIGEISAAYNIYKKILNENQRNINGELYFDLGICCKKMGKNEEASINLKRYLKFKPDNYDCLFLLGEVSFKLNDYETCKDSFNKYLRLYPNTPDKSEVLKMLERLPF